MLLATVHYPAQGLYAAGLLFGATDMDAITLSIARQSELNEVRRATAILLATVSNTLMKFALVVVFGERGLRTRVGIGFGAILVATVIALLLG